jgi:hypothetical protein
MGLTDGQMSVLVTSDVFTDSALQSRTHNGPDVLLFDEGSLLRLANQQHAREAYVRSCLEGNPVTTPYGSHGPGSQSDLDPRARIELLKRQILEVREQKKRILADGVKKVQSYRDQLQHEHEVHAREMQHLRDADSEFNSKFLAEVEQLKLKYKNHKKPIDEIIQKVKSTIARSDLADGKSISSIHVTEVKSGSGSDIED